MDLKERMSTDSEGLAYCLGLQAEANIELIEIFEKIESRINNGTLLKI